MNTHRFLLRYRFEVPDDIEDGPIYCHDPSISDHNFEDNLQVQHRAPDQENNCDPGDQSENYAIYYDTFLVDVYPQQYPHGQQERARNNADNLQDNLQDNNLHDNHTDENESGQENVQNGGPVQGLRTDLRPAGRRILGEY